MFNIMARGHYAADGALIEIENPLNHPPFLRIKQRVIVTVGNQRGGIAIQLAIVLAAAQQAHHRFSGSLTQRQVGRKKTMAVKNRQLIKGLDHDREANRCVQVAFRNRKAEAFGNQAKTNHQQEAETENDDGWMTVNEAGQGFTGHQHQANGNNYRRHHHRQMVNHADRGNNRVEGEDGVQHHDLRDHSPEFRAFALSGIIAVLPLQPFIKLNGGFEKQE